MDRLVRGEKQQTALTQQLQQHASGQGQFKTALRSSQRQLSALESGYIKLQQEVSDLGQIVEQVKGKKGPALPWQRAQEQVL